ncbi:MAG: TlyA family RNA methyltransferase [Oscillospiraceae bacterium]|nr:TlyA family RNA methyltransferase [Oscillospiraceae bacterium]
MINNMIRLDKELHSRGLAKSRTAAADLVADGKVAVNGDIVRKSAFLVDCSDLIEIVGEVPKYVSRGGLKLEHALTHFGLSLHGLVCLDVGASTGGFTDCMLQNGAGLIYAVDVGVMQLDSSLRSDTRVVCMEKCDIRTLESGKIPKTDFCTVDVSFISLKLILPHLKDLIKDGSGVVALIKPQFELGKKHSGVVTDQKVRDKVVREVADFAEESGFEVVGITESPVLGKSGNMEFLMYCKG